MKSNGKPNPLKKAGENSDLRTSKYQPDPTNDSPNGLEATRSRKDKNASTIPLKNGKKNSKGGRIKNNSLLKSKKHQNKK